VDGESVRRDLTLRGRYLDDFEKRGNEWRLKRRIIALDAWTDAPATSNWEAGAFAQIKTRGRPKPDDPLYALHPKRRDA
jgi:hypothetical protein